MAGTVHSKVHPLILSHPNSYDWSFTNLLWLISILKQNREKQIFQEYEIALKLWNSWNSLSKTHNWLPKSLVVVLQVSRPSLPASSSPSTGRRYWGTPETWGKDTLVTVLSCRGSASLCSWSALSSTSTCARGSEQNRDEDPHQRQSPWPPSLPS